MSKKFFAKLLGYIGAALTIAGTSGDLGKYSVIASSVGGVLTAGGIHNASETSAGHPNGGGTTQ